MQMPGRTYTGGSGYRYGFNGKENDNDVKGTGNQQDYGMRIYDPRLGRFLSTDPLTKGYPMLTPYQFASNRPIDGVDLDGKEWSKYATYDIKTGIFTVNLHCKIKVCNMTGTNVDENEIAKQFVKAFAASIDGVYDPKRKIKYVATAEASTTIEDSYGFGVDLTIVKRTPGKLAVAGLALNPDTQENSVSAEAASQDNATGKVTLVNPAHVANTMVHEIGHTGNVKHPMDTENTAEDVDLTPVTLEINGKNTFTFKLSPGADLQKVVSNVMTYTSTSINGAKVGNFIKDRDDLAKFSPDQLYVILQQINSDSTKRRNSDSSASAGNSTGTSSNVSSNEKDK